MANNFVKEYLKIINEEVVDAANMANKIDNIRNQLYEIKEDIKKDFEQALEKHGDVCREAYDEILTNIDNAIENLRYPFGFYDEAAYNDEEDSNEKNTIENI